MPLEGEGGEYMYLRPRTRLVLLLVCLLFPPRGQTLIRKSHDHAFGAGLPETSVSYRLRAP